MVSCLMGDSTALASAIVRCCHNQGGCERALAKIDEMDIADVKKYLKDLIRDNMVVGMEIIKGN